MKLLFNNLDDNPTKKCTRCGERKPRNIENFLYDRKPNGDWTTKDGYRAWCKVCNRKIDAKKINEFEPYFRDGVRGARRRMKPGAKTASGGISPASLLKNTLTTYEDFLSCWHRQYARHGWHCIYCGVPMTHIRMKETDKDGMSLDKRKVKSNLSFDRFTADKGYTPQNMVFCCWECNRKKGEISIKMAKKLVDMHKRRNHYGMLEL